jgi:hypothetical protein
MLRGGDSVRVSRAQVPTPAVVDRALVNDATERKNGDGWPNTLSDRSCPETSHRSRMPESNPPTPCA